MSTLRNEVAPTLEVGATAPARRPALRRRRAVTAWLFITPLVVINASVVFVPGLMNVYYSFTKWDGLSSPEWIGFQNYLRLLTDPAIHAALGRNLIWTIIFLLVPMTMGLVGASLLLRVRRMNAAYRLVFFIPYITATVVTTSIWGFLLAPDTGLGAQLGALGVPGVGEVNVLGDRRFALYGVALANIWQWWGFLLVVFYAAMQSVNKSLYEAAEIDGAGPIGQFWHVTLPGIRPTIMFLSLMTIIWSFLIFDYVYIMTGGGPAGSTEVLGTLLYKTAFQAREAGYAATIGVLMGTISFVVVVTYLYLRKKRGWEI